MKPPEFGEFVDPNDFPETARKALAQKIRAHRKRRQISITTFDLSLVPYREKCGIDTAGPPRDNKNYWAQYEMKVLSQGDTAYVVPMLMEWLWDHSRDDAKYLIDTYFRAETDAPAEEAQAEGGTATFDEGTSGFDIEVEISKRQPKAPDQDQINAPSFDSNLPPHPEIEPRLKKYELMKRKAIKSNFQQATGVVHQGQDFAWKCLLKTDEWPNWLPAAPSTVLTDPFGPGTPLHIDNNNRTSFIIDCDAGNSLTFFYDNRYFRAEISRHVRQMTSFTLSIWAYGSPSILARLIAKTINRDLEERENKTNRSIVERGTKFFSQLCDDLESAGRRIDPDKDPEFRWVRSPASGILEIYPDRHGNRGPLWGQQMEMAELFAVVRDPEGKRRGAEIDTVPGTVVKVFKSHGDEVDVDDRIMLLDISQTKGQYRTD